MGRKVDTHPKGYGRDSDAMSCLWHSDIFSLPLNFRFSDATHFRCCVEMIKCYVIRREIGRNQPNQKERMNVCVCPCHRWVDVRGYLCAYLRTYIYVFLLFFHSFFPSSSLSLFLSRSFSFLFFILIGKIPKKLLRIWIMNAIF